MIRSISVNELHSITGILLDVRDNFEYETGHFPGALNIPLSQLPDRLEQLDKKTPYVMICQGGTRSLKACHFLESLGYDVTNVEGGMLAYNDLA